MTQLVPSGGAQQFQIMAVAQNLSQKDLAALRLVSRAWCDAANGAVRQFGSTDGFWNAVQLDNLQLAATKFPKVTSLNLTFLPGNRTEQYLLSLTALSSLQKLQLYHTAAEGSAGWELLQQQTGLTTLSVACLEYAAESGIQDDFLNKVAGLQTLVELRLPLSSLATSAGLQNFSKLSHLQSLSLPVSKDQACLHGNLVTVFTALTQLTYLSLCGWPIADRDVVWLASLKTLQHIDFGNCLRLSCLCLMPLLEFPCLHSLDIVRGDEWMHPAVVAMFRKLRPTVALNL